MKNFSVRQAITTKYFAPNGHGRVKATCAAGSLFTPWDHELDPAANHAVAAQALAAKLEWHGRWVGGGTKDGYVFVFVDDSATLVVEAPKPVPEGPGMICLLQMNGAGDLKFLSSHKTEELAIERVLIAGDDDAQFVLYDAKNNEYDFGHTNDGWFFWT